MTTAYDFAGTAADGKQVPLTDYEGKVLLIVNVASKCGLTPQYEGLESLYRDHKDRGLEILGFPCNQFKEQEPGSDEEIQDFCKSTYGVTFPVLAKIEVNGPDAHPLYQFLKRVRRGIFGSERIQWNFTKFLVDRQGKVTRRYAPSTKPKALIGAIESLLDRE